jgi:hypothetical protein
MSTTKPDDRYFTKKLILLGLVAVMQSLVLTFASSWLAEEIKYQCISLDTFVTRLIVAEPRITTTVVTLMATGLSLTSAL